MKRISRLFSYPLTTMVWILFCYQAKAAMPTSYRLSHPIGWMHSLPVGEMPGWSSDFWVQSEASHYNVWNAPLDLLHRSTGESLSITADFEQTSYILEVGFALNDHIAFSLETAYARRDGGFMDQFIDNFHVFINSNRFNRPEFPVNQSNFSVSTGGEEQFTKNSVSGFGNIKYKLKFWWLKWLGDTEGSCDCGFSTSLHVKAPTAPAGKGLSSGGVDYSLMWHLGIPLFQSSAIWLTSAMTHTPFNHALEGWPTRRWHQMYEASFDFGIGDNWGFLVQFRTESPILHKKDLLITNLSGSDKEKALQRIASGWNSLVHWRGSQSMGFRFSVSPQSTINLLFVEDWGLGEFDGRGDRLYVNNAPDVGGLVQTIIGF